MKEFKKKQYIFNFTSGGWNTVWAKTKRGAVKAANQKSEEQGWNLEIVESSFRLATQKQLDSLMRAFY